MCGPTAATAMPAWSRTWCARTGSMPPPRWWPLALRGSSRGGTPTPELPGWQELGQRSYLGLWADVRAIPPWQWRHRHGGDPVDRRHSVAADLDGLRNKWGGIRSSRSHRRLISGRARRPPRLKGLRHGSGQVACDRERCVALKADPVSHGTAVAGDRPILNGRG